MIATWHNDAVAHPLYTKKVLGVNPLADWAPFSMFYHRADRGKPMFPLSPPVPFNNPTTTSVVIGVIGLF